MGEIMVTDAVGQTLASMSEITFEIPIIKADYATWEAWTESMPLWLKALLFIIFGALAAIALAKLIGY